MIDLNAIFDMVYPPPAAKSKLTHYPKARSATGSETQKERDGELATPVPRVYCTGF